MKKEIKKGLSVIIPTFNRAKYLFSTLLCLTSQKVEETLRYEIVIVDSGDDETESVVHLFQNPANVPVIYKKIKKCSNRSLVRNRGARLARYNILCFLDNDMLVPPDFIQRHYDEHQKQNHLVVMGCRRSLTEFDISALGEDTLRNNFDILEKLPWYADERLENYEDKDQWRFVFSHTLSIEAEDFYKAGQFNVDFGEHWGYEDLELGFNLMQNDCSFLLIKDSFTYHQPHFSQSNREQHEALYNQNMFLKLHNCLETELFISFYTKYGELYPECIKLKDETKNHYNDYIDKFDSISGCLFSHDEEHNSKLRLGSCLPYQNEELNDLLILKSVLTFPLSIQMAIISESFRVAKNVFLETVSESEIEVFKEICCKVGFVVEAIVDNNFLRFSVTEVIKPAVFQILLPAFYSQEKRIIYLWLSEKLKEENFIIDIQDIHNCKNFEQEDFCYDDKRRCNLSSLRNNYFGRVGFQAILSISHLLENNLLNKTYSPYQYIFNDEDFLHLNPDYYTNAFSNFIHFDESFFAAITFCTAYQLFECYNRTNYKK